MLIAQNMHAPAPHRRLKSPARLARWARLWLGGIAALINCATNLPPALQRRMSVLDLPRKVLARHVARLILLCALEEARPEREAILSQIGGLKKILRSGAQRFLIDLNNEVDLVAIARTCANPDAAIAYMVRVLERGLTRGNPILPQAACDDARDLAALVPAHADTS